MKKIISMLSFALLLNANDTITNALSLPQALEILQSQNLEVKAAKLDIQSAKEQADTVSGMNWGKLTFTQDIARSNDAGNVFGFKLTSREATFGDFGFGDPMMPPQTDPAYLTTPPDTLNYPEARNFFQSKLKYEVPLFTGFAISSYENIMNEMTKLKTLDKEKVVTEKRYELKKSFYDMALLNSSIKNLQKILSNINTLEKTTETMIAVGYAKRVDLLEVQAKKGNVERLLTQMNANKKLLYHYISFLLNRKVDAIIPPQSEVAMPHLSNEDVLQRNLDIQKAKTGLEIRENMVKSSQAAYYPTVGAFGEVATADNTFLGDASDHKAYTVGARLTWNLFNGGIDRSKIEKSKIEKMKMRTQVELAKKGIALKLAKIRTEIESSNAQIASLKKELALANAIYENYEGRYKEKLVSMSDVIIKQSAQIEKILQLQVAQNKRTAKIFALEKLANGEK
jgi:outer membrane protein TolC